MNMQRRTYLAAAYGLLAALALLLSFLETLLPMPVPVPGIKLGLANLVVLFLLLHAGPRQALTLSLSRVLLSALLFSGFSGFAFSASGALLSWLVMALLVRSRALSPVGVSLAGGLAHNLGQLAMAAAYTHSPGIIPAYLPVMMIAGAAMGMVNGVIVSGANRALMANPVTRRALQGLREPGKGGKQ